MNKTICRHCGQAGRWSWDFYGKRPVVILENEYNPHHCNGGRKDIFPGWCDQCRRTDLLLTRTSSYFQLVETYGLPHTCTENGETNIAEVTDAKCRHCSTKGLLWIQVEGRFSLVNSEGVRHKCQQYDEYQKAWAEAKRMDYAFEKAWINSKKNYEECTRCKGNGKRQYLSKNKRLMQKYGSSEPIRVSKPCKHCKQLGCFSPHKKKDYLRMIHQRYWPYRPGVHKWNKKRTLYEWEY